jgi:hypothetical protein
VKNAPLVLALVSVLLCAIPHAARAGTVSSLTVTYVLTQNVPSLDGDSPTFTWTTGALFGYVTDGTALPFLSDPVVNDDASNDDYYVLDTPDVGYEDGRFVEVSLDYGTDEGPYVSSGDPYAAACPTGSDTSGCTFSSTVDYFYEGGLDPSGFAPDVLNISGTESVPEPSSAALAILGVAGLLAANRFRLHKA